MQLTPQTSSLEAALIPVGQALKCENDLSSRISFKLPSDPWWSYQPYFIAKAESEISLTVLQLAFVSCFKIPGWVLRATNKIIQNEVTHAH